MKKTLILAALLFVAGGAVADSYLYWMVDSTAGNFDYSYARVKDVSSDTYLTLYDSGLYEYGAIPGVDKPTVEDAKDWSEGLYASLAGISDLSSASFIVELYNDQGKFLAQSFSPDGSYGSLSAYIWSGGIAPMPISPWTAGSFDIPEPSSGLLMLVGFAMLGLRRRRQTTENA